MYPTTDIPSWIPLARSRRYLLVGTHEPDQSHRSTQRADTLAPITMVEVRAIRTLSSQSALTSRFPTITGVGILVRSLHQRGIANNHLVSSPGEGHLQSVYTVHYVTVSHCQHQIVHVESVWMLTFSPHSVWYKKDWKCASDNGWPLRIYDQYENLSLCVCST